MKELTKEQQDYIAKWREAPESEQNARDFSEIYGVDYICDIDGKPVLRSIHMADIDPVKLAKSKEMLGL